MGTFKVFEYLIGGHVADGAALVSADRIAVLELRQVNRKSSRTCGLGSTAASVLTSRCFCLRPMAIVGPGSP